MGLTGWRRRTRREPGPVSVTFETRGRTRWAEVEADVRLGDPGKRSGHPDDWYPPEPGEVMITGAVIVDEEAETTTRLHGAALQAWIAKRRDDLEVLAHAAAEAEVVAAEVTP